MVRKGSRVQVSIVAPYIFDLHCSIIIMNEFSESSSHESISLKTRLRLLAVGLTIVSSEVMVTSSMDLNLDQKGIANYAAYVGLIVTAIVSFPIVKGRPKDDAKRMCPGSPEPDGPHFGTHPEWVQEVESYANTTPELISV